MNRPTSLTQKTFELAKNIGIEPVDNHGGKKTGLRLDEIRGRLHVSEVTKRNIGEVTLGSLAAAGAAFGFLGATLSTAGAVGVAGGLVTVTKIAITGKKSLKSKKYQ